MTNNFNEILKTYNPDIEAICKRFAKDFAKYKIEYDDLYQEACLKLFQVGKIDNKEHLNAIVKNHLIDHINNWKLNPLSEAESLDEYLGDLED